MFTAHIWLTNQCNLECKYCYVRKDGKSMSDEMIEKVINFISIQLKKMNERSLKIHFHGGEPLLEYKNIRKIFTYIETDSVLNKCNVIYSMTTNGMLIDNSNIDFLCQNIDDLSLSIDGNMKTHDLYRVDKSGNPTFFKVFNILQELLERKPELRLRMTVNPNTVDHLYNNIRFLIESGGIYISQNLNYRHTGWMEQHFATLEEELKKVSKYLYELNNDAIDVGMIIDGKNILTEKGKCGAGINVVSIHVNGDIYPCLLTTSNPEFIIGTVDLGINLNKVRELMTLSLQTNKCCEGCTYYKFCKNARCKLINKQETGDFFVPLPARCLVENTIYKVMKYNYELRGIF